MDALEQHGRYCLLEITGLRRLAVYGVLGIPLLETSGISAYNNPADIK
jgi:hypothetical protein